MYLYGEYALQSIYLCISVTVLLSLKEKFKDPVQPEISWLWVHQGAEHTFCAFLFWCFQLGLAF